METYRIISDLEKRHIENLAKKGQRIDGRGLNEYRDILIETNLIPKAEGSCKISLGKTEIVAGVKISTGPPYSDTPESGVITINAELCPMAAPHFESGPPNEYSVEFSRVVDRGIRHANIINKEKLIIVPSEKVFIIFIDLYVIGFDGNLFDAGSLAAVKALATTMLPEVDESMISGKEPLKTREELKWHPLEVLDLPVSVTVAKIGDTLMVDPNANEERVLDSRITFTLNSQNEIVSAQKGEAGSFKVDEIYKALGMAQEVAPKLRKYLQPSS